MSFANAYEDFSERYIFVLTTFIENLKRVLSEKSTENLLVPSNLDGRIVASLCDNALMRDCLKEYRDGRDSLNTKLEEDQTSLQAKNEAGLDDAAVKDPIHTESSYTRKPSLEADTYLDNISRGTDYELKGIAALDVQKRFHVSSSFILYSFRF